MGGGEDLFMAWPEQEDEQGLRASAGDWRSVYLRGDEPPDGEEIGSLMRVFRQFQREVPRIYLPRTPVNRGKTKDLTLRGLHWIYMW